jgi:hypothetical protein
MLMASAAAEAPVMLEEMTSTELRARIDGATTAIIPIGGTEQSGPYIALGKHNVRATVLARMIAQKLGNAVVPVVSYVPEGSITPPAGHMRLPARCRYPKPPLKTCCLRRPEPAPARLPPHRFDRRSWRLSESETRVAQRLNKAWAKDGKAGALALLAYYDVTQDPFIADLKSAATARPKSACTPAWPMRR